MKRTALVVLLVLLFTVITPCLLACNSSSGDVDSVHTSAWKQTDSYVMTKTDQGITTTQDYILCIEKDPQKDFVILNLTDIQLGDGEIDFGAEFVRRADKTIDELVNKVKPDLITVTGDQGYGTVKSIQYVGGLIDRYGIPWAPVFGNHDNNEDKITVAQQSYLYESFDNCLFKAGPDNLATVHSGTVAYGNYIVNVVEYDDSPTGFHVVRSLIFFNSNDNSDYSDPKYADQERINDHGYAMISQKQIEWYKWAVNGVQQYGKDGQVKSTAFMHIPIYAYNIAYNTAYNANKATWNEGYENSVGEKREDICSAPYDDHVYEAILDYDDDPTTNFVSTDMLVAGHDHVNDFIIQYNGITFAYGLKTGSGCYYDEDMSGGSVILVKSNGSSTIRHEFIDVYVTMFPWWIYVSIALVATLIVGVICLIIVKAKKKKH